MIEDFASLARATGLSDARLGLALGLTGERKNIAARMRQWKRGARPVPGEIAARLRALVAALDGAALPDSDAAIAALVAPAGPPEWLIGTGAPGDEEDAPEWIVHTARPRFACRLVDTTMEPEPLAGLTYADGDWVLCDFAWFDRAPEGDALRALLARTMAAAGG